MYAVVRSGGRQYRVEEGAVIDVEKLPYEVGQTVDLDEVLLVADGENATIGHPLVAGARVQATVVGQLRARKILVWKYRPKKRYRRLKGHRQQYTRLRIEKIIPA